MYRDAWDDDAHREAAALITALMVVERPRKEVRGSRRRRWRSCRRLEHSLPTARASLPRQSELRQDGVSSARGKSAVAHPASRLQSHCRLCCVACSKSIACQIYAPLGHGGPKTATVRRVAAASVPADGFSVTVPGLV